MAAPTFDLQSHSHYSDGALSPAEVVERAAGEGVELLALTDHDTVDGVHEAVRAARHHGLRLSPAAELSSVHGEHEDLHLLGYELDHTSPALRDALEDFRGDRGRRAEAMAEKLREHGFVLDDRALEERRASGRTIGRPHLADAVLDHPDNARRLNEQGITGRDAFFAAYLVPGAKAYARRTRPTVEQAIEVVHDAGGVAVWAHPFWDVDDPDQATRTIDSFAAAGLDGVECFYPTHTAEQTRFLAEACAARGLLTTGSADFHGPDHERFNRFRAFDLHGLEPRLGPIGDEAR